MLSIYKVALDITPEIHRLIAEIKRHNRKLGNQLEDAWSSVVLNIAEGSGVRDGHRTQRYMTAIGSARETLAGLEYSVCAGYIAPLREGLVRAFDRIIGTLVNNAYPRRR
jgi:four helix bundle protein